MQKGTEELLSDAEMERFLSFCLARAGASELLTPREMIRDFLTLLNILSENPGASFEELLAGKEKEEGFAGRVAAEESHNGGITLSDLDF